VAPTPVTTVVTGWPRRLRAKAAKVRVRFTVTPARGRSALVQRKAATWRALRSFTLARTDTARVSVRLGPGRYRVMVPEVPGATGATTGTLRVIRRHR
jgi:hypothetical protein